MTRNTRAVSPVFAYVLTLAITTLLIAGLLIAASGYVDEQRESVTENELEVLGQQLSADIAAADRLARTDGATATWVQRDIPRDIVGSTYTVHIRSDGAGPTEYYLELTAADLDVSIEVGIATQTALEITSVGGGSVIVEYDESANMIVVSNAS